MQIATCMIEPLSRKREDADAAVPVQQGAHRQFDLDEPADFGEKFVQRKAHPNPMLDERKLQVLYAIINSYIFSAEPIGSRTISKNFGLGVSSATIRNEMSDLEDLGYLSKPHTSSGRVPSELAYRYYVNDLLSDHLHLIKEQNKRMKDLV